MKRLQLKKAAIVTVRCTLRARCTSVNDIFVTLTQLYSTQIVQLQKKKNSPNETLGGWHGNVQHSQGSRSRELRSGSVQMRVTNMRLHSATEMRNKIFAELETGTIS
jgi:hypothetical protein